MFSRLYTHSLVHHRRKYMSFMCTIPFRSSIKLCGSVNSALHGLATLETQQNRQLRLIMSGWRTIMERSSKKTLRLLASRITLELALELLLIAAQTVPAFYPSPQTKKLRNVGPSLFCDSNDSGGLRNGGSAGGSSHVGESWAGHGGADRCFLLQ